MGGEGEGSSGEGVKGRKIKSDTAQHRIHSSIENRIQLIPSTINQCVVRIHGC